MQESLKPYNTRPGDALPCRLDWNRPSLSLAFFFVFLGTGDGGQDVTRTRSGTPALRDEKVLQWLQRSVSLFCQERGLQYAQVKKPWLEIEI